MATNSKIFFSFERSDNTLKLSLKNSWRLEHANEINDELNSLASSNQLTQITIDGNALKEVDTSGATLLLRSLTNLNVSTDKLQFENFNPIHKSLITLVANKIDTIRPLRKKENKNLLQLLGESAFKVTAELNQLVSFFGRTVVEFANTITRPKLMRTKELFIVLERDGINAIAICALVTMLIGIVIAYLFGIQIEKYGANIFIVDAVGLAMVRELSPIIVAIIIAGRSGSAFTAHIGAMKINEETDAMQTLGLSPIKVLVLPRVLGLMIALPLLVLVGDISGIIGGMLIADFQLDITFYTFIERLQAVIPVKSFLVGIIKAPVFAIVIALIGCRSGLQVENNARSLGINTTATVVKSIVSVIILNAIFAVVFQELGI
jgi:phospholipid/cholesterol/gamma-HCH transport system permease protein